MVEVIHLMVAVLVVQVLQEYQAVMVELQIQLKQE